MKRSLALDYAKSFLVIGMVYAHVIQFLGDMNSIYHQVVSNYINCVTFSGFMFCFGIAYEKAYFGKGRVKVWKKILVSGIKCLIAFYVSGIAFRIIISKEIMVKKKIIDILILNDIPGYSEFLVSFFLLTILVLLFYNVIGKLLNNKKVFWLSAGLLLLTTFIPYERVTINQIGLIIGTYNFAAFPIIQYLPFFLIGAYIARYDVRLDIKWLISSSSLTGLAIISVVLTKELPGRFPPSLVWIISPSLFIYVYYLIGLTIDKHVIKPLLFIGRNTLFFLLMSNIIIFIINEYWHWISLDILKGIEMTLIVFGVIGFISWITRKESIEKKEKIMMDKDFKIVE